jgi:hypothetical protein
VVASLTTLLAHQAKAAAKPSEPAAPAPAPAPAPADGAALQQILERLEAIEKRLAEPPEG